jgi:hypothetical protein
MTAQAELIKRELAAAEAAAKTANGGRVRVCARRAVALAAEVWLARFPVRKWSGDAMEHLRQIQRDSSFPLPVREAAERLSTPVARQHTAPFTADPIGDARLIIAHLGANPSGQAP